MNVKVDSRKVIKGDTFVALRSVNDGHQYINDAIKNGAEKIVCEEGKYDVPTLIVPDTRKYLTDYLKTNYYSKIEQLKLIGVTGTNGKTTSCFLLYQALNKLGIKCAYIGTVGFYIDGKVSDLNNTTPDILEMYEMLLKCSSEKVKYVAMEVSSHALDMGRVEGLEFDFVMFTNLTRDHLNYHKTMKRYALAKQRLFKMLRKDGKSVVNIDDRYRKYFIDEKTITYGLKPSKYRISKYNIVNNKTVFNVNKDSYTTKLLGKYNVYNMLNVIIVLNELKIETKKIKGIIYELVAPPGRMDIIHHNDNIIIVDYAHTPDAVEKIIKAVKEFAKNKVYTIVGCGGNRDKTKRMIMAKVATDLSDHVIFTSDNPRNEKPDDIIKDMVYKLDNTNYEIEVNREKAIKRAIQKLSNNDILLLLGKGHETYQIIGDKKIEFDDKKIVLDNL